MKKLLLILLLAAHGLTPMFGSLLPALGLATAQAQEDDQGEDEDPGEQGEDEQ